MTARTCLAIVLAAGEGTRMRSAKAKVLHVIAGQSMLAHVLHAVRGAQTSAVAVVIGPDNQPVADEVKRAVPDASIFIQRERRGTAHAVLAAKDALAKGADDVIVIFGDTPLVRSQTLTAFRDALARGVDIVIAGFRPADPTGYGRLVQENGKLVAIREERDASAAERAITLCNGGLMALAGKHALKLLEQIGNENAKKEFYLTDAVGLAYKAGLASEVIEIGEDEVLGVDNRTKLARGEAMMQDKLRAAAMENGATLVAPETVFFCADTKIGSDVTIEPFVVFGPGVTIGDKATIRAFSNIEGATIGEGATVGPYARLRPGTKLGKGAKIGNLSYVGDARVGEKANVGAGTITCNYDGSNKRKTDIGNGAFIGSNSALVAPVTIGAGAYIGSGSVITENVPDNALAVARGRQTIKEGWALTLKGGKGKGHKGDVT